MRAKSCSIYCYKVDIIKKFVPDFRTFLNELIFSSESRVKSERNDQFQRGKVLYYSSYSIIQLNMLAIPSNIAKCCCFEIWGTIAFQTARVFNDLATSFLHSIAWCKRFFLQNLTRNNFNIQSKFKPKISFYRDCLELKSGRPTLIFL